MNGQRKVGANVITDLSIEILGVGVVIYKLEVAGYLGLQSLDAFVHH